MASKLSIRGKQLIILCPRAHVKCVSLIYHEKRASSIRTKSATGCDLVEREPSFSRHVSVVYISVRLIISATWVRQIPLSIDTESYVDNRLKTESIATDESLLHESMFVFDKAFAQEIKYLFAELDFDLYMCRDKQGGVKRRQAIPRRIPVWRPKEQYNTFVYFVRQNNGIGSDGRGRNVGDYIEQVDLSRVLETFSDKLKNDGKYSKTGKEECIEDVTVEAYLQKFEADDKIAANLRNAHIGRNGREDAKIEDSLRMCEEKGVCKDITVEEYLRQLEESELSKDETVEEYLKYWEEEQSMRDMTVEEYLKLHEEKKLYKDTTVEEYLILCKEKERIPDMTIEEYLKLCDERKTGTELTVEEYLRLCEEERERAEISIDEYLRLMRGEISEDMTIEQYLRPCEEERTETDLTVEEYLRACEEEREMYGVTVEEYLRATEEEISQDMTVEEYLKSYTDSIASTELTIEKYLQFCEDENERNGITVEEYLRLAKENLTQDMTIEEYLRLCKEHKVAMGLTVEEYLKLYEQERENNGIPVEEYLRLAEENQSQDITVEEYLRLCKESKAIVEMTVEEYLNFCEEERERNGITVEEYLRLAEENLPQDTTIEEYLKLCKENNTGMELTIEEYLKLWADERSVRDVTVEEYLELCTADKYFGSSKEVSIEEYLRLYEENRQKEDITVEEYLRLCKEDRDTEHPTIEAYIRKCELERGRELPSRGYVCPLQEDRGSRKMTHGDSETWDDFKYALFGDLNNENREFYKVSEEVLSTEGVNKNLRHDIMVSNEDDHFSGVGSLFLPKISLHDEPDEEGLESIPFQGLSRNHLTAETEEEEIVESVVSHVESSGDTWMNFDTFEMGGKDDLYARTGVEEDLISEPSVISSNENDMEEVLQRHGLIFSAELWLLFPVYRRHPWVHISVLYRDDVRFDWGISQVIETEVGERMDVQDTETVDVFEEETIEFPSIDISRRVAVEEDEVMVSEVVSNFAEIEFSFLDGVDDEKNNNISNYNEAYSNGYEKVDENHHVPKDLPMKMIARGLKQPRRHASDEQVNKTKNIHFAPMTNLSKKGFVYKSKERIFTGSETENKLVWNNLEKIHCKHTKAITVPETLRRTVSKNNLDILESSNEDENNLNVIQKNEQQIPGALLISPLKIDNFGKDLRESNV